MGRELLCYFRVELDGRPRRQCGRHSLDARVVNTDAYLLPLGNERLCRSRVKLDGRKVVNVANVDAIHWTPVL